MPMRTALQRSALFRTLPPTRRIQTLFLLSSLSKFATTSARSAFVTQGMPLLTDELKAKHKILAFGDSLTEGFCDYGMSFHPYSLRLEQLLNENGFSAKIFERGNSGERVVGGMDHRLPALLRAAEREGVKFDWVIILGGINDLGWGGNADEVFSGLQGLYTACERHGARVLALTCLETAFSLAEKRDERSRLNDLIRDAGMGSKYVTVLDLEKKLPFPRDARDLEAARLWDDGLHLTSAGYDTMGRIVFEELQNKLEK